MEEFYSKRRKIMRMKGEILFQGCANKFKW